MTTTTFTTRIDLGLKKRLEQLAARDKRSASYVANLAIENMVDEREAIRDLVFVGLQLAKTRLSISEEDIDSWLRNPNDTSISRRKRFINADADQVSRDSQARPCLDEALFSDAAAVGSSNSI